MSSLKKSKPDVVLQAVKAVKNSEFQATGLKVELEAHLHRNDGDSGSCNYCDEGQVHCEECEDGWQECQLCDHGTVDCSICDGSAETTHNGVLISCSCSDGTMACPEECEDGYFRCSNDCDEGWLTCNECSGDWQHEDNGNWQSVQFCHDWLMERLAGLGLAEQRAATHQLSHGARSQWYPKGALAYAEFYHDGSVDSELTFTLKLDNPDNILLLPKVIEVWNDFMAAVQEGTDRNPSFSNAGMHMALLNSPDCSYPTAWQDAHLSRFDNFKRSMTLLLPALYFLGSSDATSRPLEYREPKITVYGGSRDWGDRRSGKFSAITYNQGALEFRVFNTCYDNPEVILDNFVVMSRCLKYWRSQYKSSGMEKVTTSTRFGNDGGTDLERFYIRVEHVDLLNKGLMKLKPAYYTIGQIKQQRSFRITKRTINGAVQKIRREAVVQYKEYETRFTWQMKANRHHLISRMLERYAQNNRRGNEDEATVLRKIEQQADAEMLTETLHKQPLDSFVEEQVNRFLEKRRGNFELTA